MKRFLGIFIFLIAVVTLVVTGCGGTHGYGTDATGDNPPLYPPTVLTADDDGAIAEASIGASGLKFKAEAGTLEPKAQIIITVSDSTEGSGNEYLTASAKVYDIKAILDNTTITSSEKSVVITMPNDIPGATEYYLGTRASFGDSWSFARINETNSESNPMNASARIVRAAFGSEFYIALHNLNQQFALFAHKDSSVTPKKAIITAIDCEAPSTLKEKDGKYLEDLKVNVILSAVNATQLNSSDVILKYNYQTRNSSDAAIKARSVASLKNTSETQAKAGSGNKYAHSFELSSFDNFAVNGEKINIEFTLNMTGVAVEEFAENYYIEVLAANDTDFELLPSCSCNMTLKTASGDITYIEALLLQPLDRETNVPCDMRDVYIDLYEINWTKDCEALVKVTSTNANETGAQYIYDYSPTAGILHVERQSNFAPNAEYKIEISEGIMGTAENTMVEPVTFSFTTAAKANLQ